MTLNNIIIIAAGLLAVIAAAGAVFDAINVIQTNKQRTVLLQRGIQPDTNKLKFSKKPLALFLVAVILASASTCFKIIPTGYTGVRTTFGLIDQESCMPGLNFTTPLIQKVNLVNNKQQDIRFNDQIWSETSEQTPVYMQGVAVTYQIVPESSAWIYANVENWVEELVDVDIVSSSLKSAARTFTGDEVTDRAKIEPKAREHLQTAVDGKYGENRVIIKNVIINNMDFDESYNAAIAKKSEALQKQQEQAITNQTNIDQAAAEAAAEKARAQGDADAELIRANAKAQANQIISASITTATQRQDAIDKWNGVLPQASGDNVSFGILDIANLPAANTAAVNAN